MLIGIFSVSPSGGIGINNKLLYNDIEDMKLFMENTINSIVIMGRNTWESLPKKPLRNRMNIVVTSKKPLDFLKYENTKFVSISECDTIIELSKTVFKKEDVYIIGGAKLIKEYKDKLEFLIVSRFKEDKDADTFIPKIDMSEFNMNFTKEYENFIYTEYEKQTDEDKKIINLLR